MDETGFKGRNADLAGRLNAMHDRLGPNPSRPWAA